MAAERINSLGGIDGTVRLRVERTTPGRVGAQEVPILSCDERVQAQLAVRAPLVLAPCDPSEALAARAPAYTPAGPTREEQRNALAEAAAPEAGDVLLTDEEPEVALSGRDPRLPLYGSNAFDTRAVLRPEAEGAVFVTYGFPTPGDRLDEFYETYKAHYGVRPDGSFAALGHDALLLLEDAMVAAGSTEPAAVRRELEDGFESSGALGVLRYPGDGVRVPEARLAIVRVRDGKLELVERV
jgi:hypothetical protein